MNEKPAYTHLELEAALCVWEDINLRTGAENRHEGMAEWRDIVGTVAARHASIDLARYVLQVYAAGNASDPRGDAWDSWVYDWEIVPAILDTVVFDAGDYELPTDHAAQAAAVIAKLKTINGFKTDATA